MSCDRLWNTNKQLVNKMERSVFDRPECHFQWGRAWSSPGRSSAPHVSRRLLFNAFHSFLRAVGAHVWASLTHFHLLLTCSCLQLEGRSTFQAVGCLLSLLLSQVGVQRAEPIDLSTGNEPFHINGGRGERTQAQVFLLVCGCESVAAGAFQRLSISRDGYLIG